MKHHRYNPNFQFVKDPVEFDKFTDKELLQYCLGATLYMPGTKHVVDKILEKNLNDITSIVMCFEDAIHEKEVEDAEKNVLSHLKKLADAVDENKIVHNEIPLIFIRVRSTDQFRSFVRRLDKRQANVLTGFVFPKFQSFNAHEFLSILENINENLGVLLYGMPIFEGKRIAYYETRLSELDSLKEILDPFKNLILNLRVGATDFSSLFSVRRGINYSIYDIATVRDCLSDILNYFGRAADGYTLSAPVWEYFLAYNQDDLNSLLQYDIHRSIKRGEPILNDAIDGLLKEVIIDKANGFVGKTIIHPSHACFVNALQAVTQEEYEDAVQILETSGGVIKSANSNKMNEINPHRNWAKKIHYRAEAYGVVENEASFLKMITG